MKEKNALHRLREQRGLTKEEAAAELGVSRQSVSQWESGKTFPSVKKQIVLSRLYGVPMEQLYPEGAAQEMEEPGEEAEEVVTQTDIKGVAESGRPSRSRRRIIFLAALSVFCAAVHIWGEVTHSQGTSKIFLVFVGAVILFLWILRGLHTIFTYFRKDD